MRDAWNGRDEVATRTTITPTALPTVFKNGFGDPVMVTTETFTFDRARRLTAYQSNATYQYDAHNRRVVSAIPAMGLRYQVYSRAGELLYIEDQGLQQRSEYFHLNGTLVAERTRPLASETATIHYLHSDHRGTPTVKTSTAGTRVYRSRLTPYGTPYDGIYRDGPGFTKHATDEIGPMSYMQQRYFGFDGMRFWSPDPEPARADNFNRYAYANNNPYTFVDPDGRWAAAVGGFAVGFAVDASIQYVTKGEVNFKQSAVSGLVGALTAGVAGPMTRMVSTGAVSVGTATTATAGVGLLAGPVGVLATAELTGADVTGTQLTVSAVVGSVTSGGVALPANLGVAAAGTLARMGKASVNSPAGIASHVSATTSAVTGNAQAGTQGAAAGASDFLTDAASKVVEAKAVDQLEDRK